MDSLLLATRTAREEIFRAEAALMEKLGHGQKPQVLYIGCADSQVLPSRVLGAKPGEVFAMRNMANVVPPATSGEHAVGAILEYGIKHLRIPHLVLCGHVFCGGIQTLGLDPEPYEISLNPWLHYALPILKQVPDSLRGRDRYDALVEANVRLQLEHLRTYAVVQEAVAAGTLALHGWIYNPLTGQVRAWDAAGNRFVEEPPFQR